jgi:hypothetical protein
MKIPVSIIEKYQLTPSGEQTGQSFMQNQLLYKSALPGFENIVIMECDLGGMPAKEICFLNKRTKSWGALTPEFMTNVPAEVVLKELK